MCQLNPRKCVVWSIRDLGKLMVFLMDLYHRGVGTDGRGFWLVPLSAAPNRRQVHKGAD
jgi:hypothetical protein